MKTTAFLDPDSIRSLFSASLSTMYKNEVPLYGELLDLVADVNAEVLHTDKVLASGLRASAQLDRLDVERHGAIRLGTVEELGTMRRLFGVMGMRAVGYYDLSAAGVPVHATAFRPIDDDALQRNPFRVFTSLLRLELIADVSLREHAAAILRRRSIFTARCMDLIAQAEQDGGLTRADAQEFVAESLATFRWHAEATVDIETYRALRASHPLVADVVCFKGPHINHLTPRVLDIDRAQAEMLQRGMRAKASIEGPPQRNCPILLRQTSFLALEEPIRFLGTVSVDGTHTARFGEVEQRGCALTPEGRTLYDRLLETAKTAGPGAPSLAAAFDAFPDDAHRLRKEGLAYFRYSVDPDGLTRARTLPADLSVDDLVAQGVLRADAQVYEDFLPVSAAGIFRSNLGTEGAAQYATGGNRTVFEQALGTAVIDEFSLYEATQSASLAHCMRQLQQARAESPA